MWYFDNLGAYKAAAHGDADSVARGHAAMDRDLAAIKQAAQRLRTRGDSEEKERIKRPDTSPLWLFGEYTEYNREQN
jgi:hydroxylamine dehydrogenase